MSLKVSSIQFQHRSGDKAYNLSRISHFTDMAVKAGSQFVAFPEMCITGYWHVPKLDKTELDALAEPLSGPSMSHVATLASDKGIAIGAGFVES